MNVVPEAVIRLLADVRLDNPLADPSRVECIEALIPFLGWEVVRDGMLALLVDAGARVHWWDATCVLWGGVCDKRPFNINRTVAVVNRCLRFYAEEPFDNLVWSITCNLKGVGYEAEYFGRYSPTTDVEVCTIIERIDAERQED